jgi:NAD(P)H-hydrate repair Nnr-like enzyme with NAD(P)H-hydrate dehydratase domain
VLLIGGDQGFGGAILLSAKALRSGAGMVSWPPVNMSRQRWPDAGGHGWALRRPIS